MTVRPLKLRVLRLQLEDVVGAGLYRGKLVGLGLVLEDEPVDAQALRVLDDLLDLDLAGACGQALRLIAVLDMEEGDAVFIFVDVFDGVDACAVEPASFSIMTS